MEKKIIEIPTSLNDIPLWKYQQFLQIDQEASQEFQAKRTLQIFCDIQPKEFRLIKHQVIENLLFKIGNVLNSQPKFQRTFEIDGVRYGIIPNFDDMTMGEFVDLDSIKDYKKDLDKLMSILYRKITKESGDRYEVEPYGGAYRFRNIPTNIATGALVFFHVIGVDCLTATQKFTNRKAKQTQRFKGLVKNGDGTDQSLASAMETLASSILSLTKNTIASYYGLPTKAIWLPYNDKK